MSRRASPFTLALTVLCLPLACSSCRRSSNAPPTVAGVIALMLSANRSLPIGEVKQLLVETADVREGFRVLNAEAAMAAAIARRGPSQGPSSQRDGPEIPGTK